MNGIGKETLAHNVTVLLILQTILPIMYVVIPPIRNGNGLLTIFSLDNNIVKML